VEAISGKYGLTSTKLMYGFTFSSMYKEKFVILQSIGIIRIKSSETRAVIYTCRYFFNPEFSPLAII